MTTDPDITHVGFGDESNWNKGRFRSLGLVTTPLAAFNDLNEQLRHILDESDVKEFKWQNLRQARERFAAEKMCDLAVEAVLRQQLRVDVLIWDIEDSRHKITARDDIANLQRMYYHLFRNVLRARWPDNAVWRLHPDEHTALDWETVQDCLEAKSTKLEPEHSLFPNEKFRERLRREFRVEEIRPVFSQDSPLLQLADLFAGLAIFSYDKFQDYQRWLQAKSPQKPLLNEADDPSDPSRASKERFAVLQRFDEACKRRKLGVSLKTRGGLWTPNPQNPINFWMYEPQHPEDRAPQRRG